MLALMTPSKTMDFEQPLPIAVAPTRPLFLEESQALRRELRLLSSANIQSLMKVSGVLAEATVALYATQTASKPALWAYVGDVYKGFQARTLSVKGAEWAQTHLIIPSGLYGLLRPFDAICGYRLEMKTPLVGENHANLPQFWGEKLGSYTENHADGELLILSSQEYAKTIQPFLSAHTRVVTPAFVDKKPSGKEEQVAIYNKLMRGVMARWIVDERIDNLVDITAFSAHGYRYSAGRSTPEKPVFYRPTMIPLILDK